MEGDDGKGPDGIIPANDNDGTDGKPDAETWQRIDRAALTLARIIGRRMAREDFAALTAANDNQRPNTTGKTEDEADKD
jgi:hypothetical protein